MLKRLLPTILVAAALLGVFAPFSLSLSPEGMTRVQTQTASAQTPTKEYNYTTPYDQISQSGTCGAGFGQFAVCLEEFFYYIPYALGGQAIFWAAKLFDSFAALTLSSKIYSASSFITQGWQITRDFSNIFFILILLYIALSFVLGIEIGHANPRKMLASVILIAVLINFSLFLTQVVIDASNALALIFYNQIQVSSETTIVNKDQKTIDDQTQTVLGVKVKPISEALVKAFSPQFLYSGAFYENLTRPVDKSWSWKGTAGGAGLGLWLGSAIPIIGNAAGLITGTVLGFTHDLVRYATLPDQAVPPQILIMVFLVVGIMLCVAAYCLFVGAFAFLGRLVELWISIIFAPLAFISYIIPGTRTIGTFGWKEWSEKLFSAAFSAPIFMFFLLLISLMTKSIVVTGDVLKQQNSIVVLFTLLIPFLLLTAMLLKAAKYVKKASGSFGTMFAELGVNAAKLVGGFAVGTASGVVARAGQKTLGAWGKSWRTEELKDLAAGNITSNLRSSRAFRKFGTMSEPEILRDPRFAQMRKDAEKTLKASTKLTSASFDLRHNQVANAVTSATGMSFGSLGFAAAKNTVGGVDGKRARDVQKMREFAELLGENHDQKTALENSTNDRKDEIAIQERILKQLEEDGKVAGTNAKILAGAFGSIPSVNNGVPQQHAQQAWIAEKSRIDQEKRGIATTNADSIARLKGGHQNAILGSFTQEEVNAGQAVDTDLTVAGHAPRVPLQTDVGMIKDQRIAVQQQHVGQHYADGQEILQEHIGRRIAPQHLGVDHLEDSQKKQEQTRTRSYFHQKMLDTGYAVHGEKFDKLGNMYNSGHIDMGHKGVSQWRRVFREALGGQIIGAGLGFAIAGPVGAAVGSSMAGVRTSLDAIRELLGNLDHRGTDIFGRTGQAEAATEASDLSHKVHAFTQTYKTPSSWLSDLLKPLSSAFKSSGGSGGGHSGGGGGHSGGGHSGGGGGHGGGGHGGGHGGH